MDINIGIDTKNREQIAAALSKVQADTYTQVSNLRFFVERTELNEILVIVIEDMSSNGWEDGSHDVFYDTRGLVSQISVANEGDLRVRHARPEHEGHRADRDRASCSE